MVMLRDTPSKTSTLFDLADAQAGYFTAKQAEQAGYSRRMQHYHQAAGNWERTARGLYRLCLYPRGADDQYAELTLWSRNLRDEPQAVLGYETALRLHELSDLDPAVIHLIVPPGFRKKPPEGVRLRHGQLRPQDTQNRGSFRVTTPLRTLLDVAQSAISPEHLQAAILGAVQGGLVSVGKLRQALSEADLPAPTRRYAHAALEQA